MKQRIRKPNNNNVAYVYNVLNLNESQEQFIVDNFGCSRFLYNELVTAYNTNTSRLTVKQYKKQYDFLAKADSLALCNTEKDFVDALIKVKKN